MASGVQKHQPRVLRKYDIEIVQEATKYLCEDKDMTETIEDVQDEVETRIGRTFRSSLLPLFKSFPDKFDIDEEGGSSKIRAKTRLELCPSHCGKQKNCDGLCNKLHVCKFYLLSDSCKTSRRCQYGHDFLSSHNRELLREHYLGELDIEELRNLFKKPNSRCQVTRPPICKFYSDGTECRSERSGNCPFLHLCKSYVTGRCSSGRRCRKSHNMCHPTVKDVLEKYGIDTERRPKDVLTDVKTCFAEETGDKDSEKDKSFVSTVSERRTPFKPTNMTRSKSNPCLCTGMSAWFFPGGGIESTEEKKNRGWGIECTEDRRKQFTGGGIESTEEKKNSGWGIEYTEDRRKQSVDICIYHLRGKCRYGDKCHGQHKDFMYQWQFADGGEWTDFKPSSNIEIEMMYCDVNNTDCHVKFGRQITMNVDFIQMRAQKRRTLHNIRRLSTESSAVQKFQPLATEYKWYWQDQHERWILYGGENVTGYAAMLDSDSLEMNYQENPFGQMKFKTSGNDYMMDFQRMVQKNVIHKTERDVRRRPVFVNSEEIGIRKKRSADTGSTKTSSSSMVVPAPLAHDPTTYIPTSWDFGKRKRADDISDHFKMINCQWTSPEANQLKKLFFETMSKSFSIGSIKRIENGELWMNFVSKKEKMKRKKKDGNITELQLFHGTNEEIVDAICRQGFDFRFSGSKTGHKYGKGSYFAKMAQTADSYTDFGDKKHMFIVRVLAGDFAPGETTFVRPPPRNPRDPFELYDSCVDSVGNPNIFVIFTFDQVYPEYVIEYQRIKK